MPHFLLTCDNFRQSPEKSNMTHASEGALACHGCKRSLARSAESGLKMLQAFDRSHAEEVSVAEGGVRLCSLGCVRPCKPRSRHHPMSSRLVDSRSRRATSGICLSPLFRTISRTGHYNDMTLFQRRNPRGKARRDQVLAKRSTAFVFHFRTLLVKEMDQ